MAIYTFGAGTLWATRTDVANATPTKFGALQSVDLEFSSSSKTLYGQFQFPLAVARGTSKITGKAKFGQIQGRVFSDLFFGASLVTGQLYTANGEAGTVAAASPYEVTVVNAATFVGDLGVIYTATGLPLQKVAATPAAGQYMVAAGVYTFAAADEGAAVKISYTYSIAAAGQKMVYTNQLLGVQPVFQTVLETSYTAPSGLKKAVLNLHACVSSKLTASTKQEDFMIPELDFDAFADDAGELFDWSFNEAS